MAHRQIRIPAAIAGAALLLVACGGGGDDGVSSTEQSSPATDVAPTGAPSTDPPQTNPPATDPVSEARCANADGDGGFDDISCDELHDSEFSGLVAAPSGDAPLTEDEEDLQLATLCAPAADALVSHPTFPMGLAIQYVSSTALGDAYSGDIECWVSLIGEGVLIASMTSEDFDTALGEYEPVEGMEVGSCFAPPSPETIGVGLIGPCSETDGELLFAMFELEDRDFPGSDALFKDGSTRCNEAARDYEVSIDSDLTFVTYPDEVAWAVFGQRTILCTALTSGVGTDAPSITQPEPDLSGDNLVEIEVPAGFVFGAADPVCSIEAEDDFGDETFYAASCDEVHNAELVALIEPPAENLPTDSDEAVIFFNEMCLTPVVDATGADLFRPGVSIGFNVPGALGEPYDGPIACYATIESLSWVGSFQDLPLEEVLFEQVIIADLEPGACFTFAADSFASGFEVSCDDPDAIMSVGSYQAADRPYPSIDELRDERAVRCAEVLAASGLVESGVAGDPATLSGSFPGENPWNVPGRRFVTCDIEPA